MLTLIFLYR